MAAKQASLKVATKEKWGRVTLLNIKRGRIDYVMLLIVLILLVIGLVSLFSASFANALAQYKDSFYFINDQVIFGIGGVALMLFISTINYRLYERFVWPLYFITVGLLIWALMSRPLNGANRWVFIAGRTFQPSELAKFTVILLVSHLLALNYDKMKDFKKGVLPVLLFVMPIAALILVEVHISATIIILGMTAVMLFVGGLDIKWFIILGATALIGGFLMYKLDLVQYFGDRIDIWLNPYSDPDDLGYQTIQALNAIGSGGLMGKGIGGSTQKYNNILPEIQNDYVFAIVCEELGFVGALIIIFLFMLLVWRGVLISSRCNDRFGSFLATGIVAQIGIQVMFNIAVITNTVPPTGVSMPFFSSGGTSLILILMQMGVLLSVSRRMPEEQQLARGD